MFCLSNLVGWGVPRDTDVWLGVLEYVLEGLAYARSAFFHLTAPISTTKTPNMIVTPAAR